MFGNLRVRIDPWQADYGSELPLELPEDDASDASLDIEVPALNWAPIQPEGSHQIANMVFVDGVRRIEARLIIQRHDDTVIHGAFGSFAVGAVRVANGRASFDEAQVGRHLIFGSGEHPGEVARVHEALQYLPVSTDSTDPVGPLQRLQDNMRQAEEDLAKRLAATPETLVVADGPLTFEGQERGSSIGFVKRLFKLYIPRTHLSVLSQLGAGERTPLFSIPRSKRFARYSWFLRLAPPSAGDSDLSGIVRLEVSETVGIDIARRLADSTTRVLPKFAPTWSRDPRAPQNLLPIGALETHLRHRLGNLQLVRRQIKSLIAREAING
jgi:hypothetical protein